MIKKLFACCVLLASIGARAQSLSPEVIATDGNYYSSSSASLSWTLGEVATDTYSSSNNMLTQGFQQPELLITSVEAVAEGVEVSIYPNPSAGLVSIQINSAAERKLDMQLLDMSGKLISKREEKMTTGTQTVSIDLSSLAAGQYMLRITDTNANTRSTYTIQKNN